MTFQIGNRDEDGVLIGSFEQDGAELPIDVQCHIVPFLYPCQKCQSLLFHVVGKQQGGLGIKIPFMRKPLVGLSKQYLAICNQCTMINSQIPKDVVHKLENGIIDPQISAMYSAFCEPPEPYSEGFAEDFVARFTEASADTVAFVRKCLAAYRRQPRQ